MKRAFLLLIICSAVNIFAAENIKKVFISQLTDHPALNMTVKGIIDGLEQNGYKRGVNLNLKVESALGNAALASQIAAKFVNQKADVVVGVGTISAQSFFIYAKDDKIKLVFSSVTDPIKAKLVQSLKKPGNNISGVSNFIDLEPQIELFRQIQPGLKRLGFLYNPVEINSLSLIEKLKELCQKLQITLVLQSVINTSTVAQEATKLAKNVDAIFISNDSTALSALKVITSISTKLKVPVYISDTDAVELGALAALGPSQYKVGVQTAKIIARSLNGEDLSDMPVEFPNDTELYLNEVVAKKIGVNFPTELKTKASKIIGSKDYELK